MSRDVPLGGCQPLTLVGGERSELDTLCLGLTWNNSPFLFEVVPDGNPCNPRFNVQASRGSLGRFWFSQEPGAKSQGPAFESSRLRATSNVVVPLVKSCKGI